jgi:hypothetical protein
MFRDWVSRGASRIEAASGRVKSLDLDVSMSGEDSGGAVELLQAYAGTRPHPDIGDFRFQ